jgi:hypothetical protein
MNPLKYDKPYQEALGTFEGFRKLGFSADDIYLTINGPLKEAPFNFQIGMIQVLVTLRTQGKFFHMDCGVLNDTPANATKKWSKMATAMNEGRLKPEHLNEVWEKSLAHTEPASFIHALKAKGFIFPKEASSVATTAGTSN